MINEYAKALRYIWYIISIGTIVIWLLLLIIPEIAVMNVLPRCEWQTMFDRSCFFCGMSRGMIQLIHGHFSSAQACNSKVVPMALVLTLNEGLFIFHLWLRRNEYKKSRHHF